MKRRDSKFSSIFGFAQGTIYHIIFKNKSEISSQKLKNNIENILKDIDMSLSIYKESSIVSKINRNEDVTPDTYFIEVFKKSKEIYVLTGGAFDVTVGSMVNAWGFGPEDRNRISEIKQDSFREFAGMRKIDLVNGKIIKDEPWIQLDFNAIAKGYAVDVLSLYMDEQKIDSYLVEIGGEVRTRGSKSGSYWRIGIDKPVDNNIIPGNNTQTVIRIKNKSLATSGNYRKFYNKNGIKYSHTIDPRTGCPVSTSLLSTTVIGDNCASADAIATACMVMDKDKAITFLRNNPQFEAFLIVLDERGNPGTWVTENIKNYISENYG